MAAFRGYGRLVWVSFLVVLVAATSAASGAAASALGRSSSSFVRRRDVETKGERSLAVYALYNVPGVTMSFRTMVPSTSTLLLSGISASDADLEFGDVLQGITKNFLLNAFRARVTSMAQEDEVTDFYTHLQTIDLEAAELYIDNGLGIEAEEKNDSDNTRRRLEGHQLAVTVRYAATLAFLEPTSSASKPSNEDVAKTFGMWMDDAFSADRDIFLKALLQQYDSDVLRQVTYLKVTVEQPQPEGGELGSANMDTGSQKNDGGSTWLVVFMVCLGMIISGTIVGLALHLRHTKRGPWWDSRSYILDYPESDSEMSQIDFSTEDSPANKGARSVLQASDVYLSKHRPDLFQAVHGRAAQPFPTSSTNDPVTGRTRRTSIFSQYLYGNEAGAGSLEGGHEYQTKETPPLLSIVGRNHSESEVSSVTSGLSAFRSYMMPSNPFELIYGKTRGAAETNPPEPEKKKGLARPPMLSRRSSSFTPRGNTDDFSFQRQQSSRNFAAAGAVDIVESQPSYDDGSDHFGDQPSAHTWPTRPIASIWRNISTMWDGHSAVATHEDPAMYSEDGIQYQGSDDIDGENGVIFRPVATHHQFYPSAAEEEEDEPEPDYPFAFQDFPRHDGTPCLIYSEDEIATRGKMNNEPRFVITDDDGELDDVYITPRNSMSDVTKPVSNRAFQKMLSIHSLMSVDSLKEDDEIDSDGSDSDDNSDKEEEEDNGSAEKTRLNKEFLSKLDRVMAQRHRQYEKRAIVEKHREARARERAEVREKERRERHTAMERGIEELESTLLSPLAAQPKPKGRIHTSPLKHYDGSRKSPSHHRSTSSSSVLSTSPKSTHSTSTATFPARHKGMPDLKINTKFTHSPFTSDRPHPFSGSEVDDKPVDTLSIPPMGPNKNPSPNSVMDDLGQLPVASSYMRKSQGGRNPHPLASVMPQLPGLSPGSLHRHRRVHSFDNDNLRLDVTTHGCSGSGVRPAVASHSSHRRVYSGHSIPVGSNTPTSQHRRTLSQGHKRSLSSSSHRRSNSTSDDLLVHGVYAQTRFV